MGFLESWSQLSAALPVDLPVGPPVVDLQRTYNFSGLFFHDKPENLMSVWNSSMGPASDMMSGSVISPSNLIADVSFATGASVSQIQSLSDTVQFNLMLQYMSSLIKSVTPPSQNIQTKEFNLGPLIIEIPDKVTMERFDVVFMGDILGIVEQFYRTMFLAATSSNRAAKSNYGSFTFTELSKLALSFSFTRRLSTGNTLLSGENLLGAVEGLGVSIPGVSGLAKAARNMTTYHYPKVFPVEITQPAYDKSSAEVAEITLTFIRIPTVRNPNRFALQGQNITG